MALIPSIGTASKASPAPLPKPLAIRKRSPHVHHCGGGVTRVLTQGTVNHLQVFQVLERDSASIGFT